MWLCTFDAEDGIGCIKLTLFQLDSGSWIRQDVTLTQRCYDESDVIGALQTVGFQEVTVSVEAANPKLSGRGFFRGVR